MPFTAFPIPSAELSTVAADARAAISAAQAIQIVTTSTLQAVRGGRYIIEYAGQCEVSDPTGSNAAGDSYEVWIGGSGSTARFGGAGTVYSPSRFSIRRRCSVAGSPGTWVTPAPMLTDTLTVGSNTWSGSAFSGAQAFSSTTRPTSAGTGIPAATSLITYEDSENMLMRDSCYVPLIFSQGSTSTAGSGTSNASRGYWQLYTSTTASSKAHVYFDCTALIDSASTLNFDRRIVVKTKQYIGALAGLRSGLQYYVQLGRTVATTTTAQLDKKGFGFGVTGTTVTPFVHNGTTLTTTLASGSTFSIVTYPWVMLDFRPGNGLYVYGVTVTSSTPVLLATITSGLPSGTSSSGDGQLEFLVYDTGSGGAANFLFVGTASISNP